MEKGLSLRKAAEKHGVAKSTLARRKISNALTKKASHPKVLSDKEEEAINHRIVLAASWGYPLSTMELRMYVRQYLNQQEDCGTIYERFAWERMGLQLSKTPTKSQYKVEFKH